MSVIAGILLDDQNVNKPELRAYLAAREVVSFTDDEYGGGTSKTDAENAAAINAAIADLRADATVNGGIVWMQGGTYSVAPDTAVVPPNIWLMGQTPTSAYDSDQLVGGTTLSFTAGTLGLRQYGALSRVSNMRLKSAVADAVKYGLLVTAVSGVTDHVSASDFEYGIVAANLNSNHFHSIQCWSNSKIGFCVLPSNAGGVGAFAYPDIESLIEGTASTTFTIDGRSKFSGNLIGMALLSGYNATIRDAVFESNDYYGILIFKRNGVCNDFHFSDCWQEDDARVVSPTVWSLTGIEALQTSAGANYLVGDVNGAWSAAADQYKGIWIGSAVEAVTEGSDTVGPPHGIRFTNCRLNPNGIVARLRSQKGMLFDSCLIQSATTTTAFLATDQSRKLTIRNPKGAISSTGQIGGMTVPGRDVVYEFVDTFLKGTVTSATNGAWNTIVADCTALSKNNKYEYVASPSGQYALYGARGIFYYDGTDITLEEDRNGSGCDMRISGTALQYQQNSGGDIANVRWKIHPRGPVEYV